MLYGRLSVDPGDLFGEVLLTGYSPIPWDKPILHWSNPNRQTAAYSFRGSVESDFGKLLDPGKWAGGEASGTYPFRKMNGGTICQPRPERTDILMNILSHQKSSPLSNRLRMFHPAKQFINVTVRSVNEDKRSKCATPTRYVCSGDAL